MSDEAPGRLYAFDTTAETRSGGALTQLKFSSENVWYGFMGNSQVVARVVKELGAAIGTVEHVVNEPTCLRWERPSHRVIV
jgi:hypothetical protein